MLIILVECTKLDFVIIYEINKDKAFTYYLKSAEAGNSMEIWKTAWSYCYGIGVEGNWSK